MLMSNIQIIIQNNETKIKVGYYPSFDEIVDRIGEPL